MHTGYLHNAASRAALHGSKAVPWQGEGSSCPTEHRIRACPQCKTAGCQRLLCPGLHSAVCTEHLPALQSRSAALMSSVWVCPAVAIWETSALPSQRAGGSYPCPACYQAPSVQRDWSSCTLLSTVQEQILHLMSNASLNLALKIHVSPARNC